MRPSLGEVSVALYGAWRLMRFDPNGLNYFDATTDAFWKSFYAAAYCIPGTLIFFLISGHSSAGSIHTLISHSLAYVVSWIALPVILLGICEVIGRQNRYIKCVIAINWSTIIRTYLQVPLIVASFYEGTLGFWGLMSFAALLFVLVYEGYIFHRSLEISVFAASGLVATDFVISLLLNVIVSSP